MQQKNKDNEWVPPKLKDFIHRSHPGAEIRIIRPGDRWPGMDWSKLPFTWNSYSIYIREKPVTDRRMRGSA